MFSFIANNFCPKSDKSKKNLFSSTTDSRLIPVIFLYFWIPLFWKRVTQCKDSVFIILLNQQFHPNSNFSIVKIDGWQFKFKLHHRNLKVGKVIYKLLLPIIDNSYFFCYGVINIIIPKIIDCIKLTSTNVE